MTISVEPNNMPNALALAEQFDDVYATLGVHPHEATLFEDSTVQFMRENCGNKKVVAVGNIDLDYFYEHSPREPPRYAFLYMLEVGMLHQFTVVIATRVSVTDYRLRY